MVDQHTRRVQGVKGITRHMQAAVGNMHPKPGVGQLARHHAAGESGADDKTIDLISRLH